MQNNRSYNLVLLAGLNNTKDLWSPLIQNLSDEIKTFPVDMAPLDTLSALSQELLMNLPQKFYLLGFSFGGYVAFELLRQAPERVLGLILINTSDKADSPAQKQNRQKAIDIAIQGEYEDFVESLAGKVFHPDNLNDEGLLEMRKKMVSGYGPERYVAHQKASMGRPDSQELTANVALPILVVSGSDDLVIPASEQEQMARRIQSGTYECIERAGHMMPMEKPFELAQLVNAWLAKLDIC